MQRRVMIESFGEAGMFVKVLCACTASTMVGRHVFISYSTSF